MTGTMSLGWSWGHHDPVQGQGWQLGVLEWGQSVSHPTFPCGQVNQLAEMCVGVKEGKQRWQ